MLPEDEYYYRGEHDDFDAYVDVEAITKNEAEADDLPGYKEPEEEFNFEDWEEDIPLDPWFEEELKKQRLDLRKKADELEKISDVIKIKAELQKVENKEKQRLHNIQIQ